VALFAWVVTALMVVYPPDYVLRAARWGPETVGDHLKFPTRALHASGKPYHFAREHGDDALPGRIAAAFGVDALEPFLEATGTHGFIVIVDDTIRYEGYFNGADRETLDTVFSVTKSFTSALVGAALADGLVRDVDDPVTRYLPELGARDGRFARITLRHLLTMSSGIRYVDVPFLNGDNVKVHFYPDVRRLTLTETAVTEAPGARFVYSDYGPLLLGLVLERVTGRSVSDYLQTRLWTPIGMEYAGAWTVDREGAGLEKLDGGLAARAIDLAKLGRLYLNEGRWGEHQVLPAQWVADSTQEHRAVGYEEFYPAQPLFASRQAYYGYMWWGQRRAADDADFYASGYLGQYVYVSPRARMIIVRTGERTGVAPLRWIEAFSTLAGGRVVTAGRPDSG
jgi:CubicO group peptidase (beta-lactamase class C family)